MKKGIILAGGSATRLRPVTSVVSKQLLPVYDKPLIYYPLSTLMLAGVRDVLLISSPDHINSFRQLLGDGSQWGIDISYAEQKKPQGIAQALVLAEDYLEGRESVLILGDNLFHGPGLGTSLSNVQSSTGATVTAYQVSNPTEFGVVTFDENHRVLAIEEKPKNPSSNWVIPGLYFYDSTAPVRAKSLTASSRGELEITDLNRSYLSDGLLGVQKLSRGTTWFDMGTPDSLLDAAEYVRMIQKRQGLLVGSPDEVSWREGWVPSEALTERSRGIKSSYGRALRSIVEAERNQWK